MDSKIEIYHNQLTKYQGLFSPRAHYNTFGLHVIARNLGIPSVVLDFPTLPRFIQEVRKGYDYVGIGSIVPNFEKVKRMVQEVRRHSPRTKIIIGGFCATIENLNKMLDVDYICAGEGISFMRGLLGLAPEYSFCQPDTFSEPREILGVPLFWARTNARCCSWAWAARTDAIFARRAISSAENTSGSWRPARRFTGNWTGSPGPFQERYLRFHGRRQFPGRQ